MGFRFRKSFKAGPFRVNLSKSGIGYSVGTKGFRYTKKAGGGSRTTASIPGTGVSYVQESGRKKKGSNIQNKKETRSKAMQQGTSHRYLQQPQGPTLGTVILAWVLGMFGAHKFQQKKIGMGILYLATFGLFCVGWLGDAITLTMQYSAKKSDKIVPPWKKAGVYILIGICLITLGSCGKESPKTIPSETTIPTEVETEPTVEYTEQIVETKPPVVVTTAPTVETSEATTAPTQPPVLETTAVPVQQTEPTEEMVWIPTGGGTKYHSRSGCSQMNNPSQVPVSTAISRGFTPCKRCH